VKPSTGARKTLKAWLKDQKSKVDKEAAAATVSTESGTTTLPKQGIDGTQDVETDGLEFAPVDAGQPSLTSIDAIDEEPLPSVEVSLDFHVAEHC
jgi:hypothetical protein